MKKERWRTIPGCELYEASDLGRIRRSIKAPRTGGTHPGRLLKTFFHPKLGRYYVRLSFGPGRPQKSFYVHKLVCLAFLGVVPKGKEVNHRDGDKKNNQLKNLEYVTRRENLLHAYRLGLMRNKGISRNRGEKNGAAKLTAAMVISIRHQHLLFVERIASRYAVSANHVRAIIAKKRPWRSLLQKGV